MAYGTSLARAYYGAGDWHSAAALRSSKMFRRGRPAPRPGGIAYARGYYAAGGFFSKLVKNAGRIASAVTKVGAGFATGGVLGAARASLGLLSSGAAAKIPTSPLATGLVTAPLASSRGGGLALAKFAGRGSTSPRRRRKKSRSARSRRRRGSSYRRGDWGDDGGRDKHGHFLNARGGHHNFKRRRKRRGGRGGKVSFTTKDGRRVSFTAKARPWDARLK